MGKARFLSNPLFESHNLGYVDVNGHKTNKVTLGLNTLSLGNINASKVTKIGSKYVHYYGFVDCKNGDTVKVVFPKLIGEYTGYKWNVRIVGLNEKKESILTNHNTNCTSFVSEFPEYQQVDVDNNGNAYVLQQLTNQNTIAAFIQFALIDNEGLEVVVNTLGTNSAYYGKLLSELTDNTFKNWGYDLYNRMSIDGYAIARTQSQEQEEQVYIDVELNAM